MLAAAALLFAITPPLSAYGPTYSSCIPSSPDPQHVCDFLVEIDWEGGEYVLVLSEKIGMEGKYAKWKRTDAILYPTKKETEDTVGGNGGVCEYNGKRDEQVVAIAGRNGTKQWLTSISHAWKIDVKTKKFVEIPTKTIRCENEGWGI
jgi:hypothetical protein